MATVIDIVLCAIRGVQAAHARGVVHRDLKPDNIFLCRGTGGALETVKVLDFGISKRARRRSVQPRADPIGRAARHALLHVARAAARAEGLDQRADVYAFGVILYEALTGRLPFRGNNYGALALEIGAGTPQRPRELRADLSPALEQLVLKAMARDRDQRYPDLTSLIAAIEGLPQTAGPYTDTPLAISSATEAARSSQRFRSRAWVLLVLAIAVGVSWMGAHLFGKDTEGVATPAAITPVSGELPVKAPPTVVPAAVAAPSTPPEVPAPPPQPQMPTSPIAAPNSTPEQPPAVTPAKAKARPRKKPQGQASEVAAGSTDAPSPTQRPSTRTNARVVAEDF